MTDKSGFDVLLAPNPSPMTGRGTNTYVLGQGEVLVIDPGPSDRGHLKRVAEAALGRGQVSAVLLTHHHFDHAEGAAELAAMVQAPLASLPHPEAPALDRELRDGEELAFGGGTVRVVHTPGHTRGHACFWWPGTGTLFAGDLVAGEGFIVIDPPDGDMAEYFDSLRRARELDAEVIRPGHGPAIEAPSAYLDGYIAHRLEREAKVLAALGPDPRIIPQLLPTAYDDTPEAIYPVASRSLVAHLEKLAADGIVEIVSDGPEAAYKLRE